jgi:hypothetical protein
MKKIICILAILLLMGNAGTLRAQSSSRIKGQVVDVEKKPVVSASVALLLMRDSGLVKITITDEQGYFELEHIKPDAYVIKVTNVGFSNYSTGPVEVTAQDSSITLPAVQLERSGGQGLTGVTVTTSRSYIERKIDRTVVNVEALISNSGANALEVLEKLPGVMVGLNGGVSLKGKQGVVVLIDDKPTHLSGNELASYLRSLPSSVLDKIELMPNPPAKYDAAGNAGVINIRMKKVTTRGFNGSLTSSYGQGKYARFTNSVNFNYRYNKINLFGNLSYLVNNSYQELDLERFYRNSAGMLTSAFTQNSYFVTSQRTFNRRLGFDYSASAKTTWGVLLSGFVKPFTQTADNKSYMSGAHGQVDSVIFAHNREEIEWRNGGVNLNFRHKINNEGREISIDADHIRYSAQSDQSFINNVFDPQLSLKNSNQIIGSLPSDIHIFSAKSDYSQPLSNGMQMTAGLKWSLVETDNEANYFNRIGSSDFIDADKSNHFLYSEKISAAYMSMNREGERISMQIGLRLENTSANGHQIKKDSVFNRNYTQLFPTAFFSYKLDTNGINQFNLTYGRRISRPNYQDLNPFLFPIDKFSYLAGNPFLKPQFSHNIELAHMYKDKFTTTLMYSHTKDLMFETVEQSGNIFISRTGNIGAKVNIGITSDIKINAGKHLTAFVYSELINSKFRGNLYGQVLDNNITTWLVSFNNQFKLNKGWSAELSAFYRSKQLNGQFINDPVGQMSAGVQKKVLQNRGTVKVNVRDIFHTVQPRGKITNVAMAEANFHNYLDTRVATLSFTYNFGKGSGPRNRGNSAQDEQNRIQTSK